MQGRRDEALRSRDTFRYLHYWGLGVAWEGGRGGRVHYCILYVQCHFAAAWSYCTASYITDSKLHTYSTSTVTVRKNLTCHDSCPIPSERGLLIGGLVEAFWGSEVELQYSTGVRMRCAAGHAMPCASGSGIVKPADKIHAKEGFSSVRTQRKANARQPAACFLRSTVLGSSWRYAGPFEVQVDGWYARASLLISCTI
jgi:hypothetical protein